MLGDVGTLSWYKRRGAATALISWPFEDADKDKLVVYLDTDQTVVLDGSTRDWDFAAKVKPFSTCLSMEVPASILILG